MEGWNVTPLISSSSRLSFAACCFCDSSSLRRSASLYSRSARSRALSGLISRGRLLLVLVLVLEEDEEEGRLLGPRDWDLPAVEGEEEEVGVDALAATAAAVAEVDDADDDDGGDTEEEAGIGAGVE